MDLATRRYETFPDLYEVLHQGRFGGGTHLPEHLRRARSRGTAVRDRSGRCAPADEHPSRHPGRHGAGAAVRAARGSARARMQRSGPPRRGRCRRPRRALAGRACPAPAPGRTRARLLPPRGPGAAASRSPVPGGRRDHGRHLPRPASAGSSGTATTCSRASCGFPRPRRAVIAAATWARTVLLP